MSGAPLRLLMSADAVGGVWTYALDLAGALRPLGVETTLAIVGPAPSPTQRAAVPAGVSVIETGLPLDWLAEGPAAVRAAATAMAGLAADHDLAQLNTPSLADALYPVPTVAVAHGCLATWWAATEGGAPPADMGWQVAATQAGLRRVGAVVAPTRAFAETVRRLYGLATAPACVHNGRAAVAASAGVPLRAEAFTAGRLWDRAKNVRVLDAAAARTAVPIRAAGMTRAPHGETIQLDHLVPLGHVDERDLARELAARPVFVTAAWFEPFGLAVLEAAQAGCALVLSDIATFRELWDGAAAFVPADDAEGFARAIDALAANPSRREALGDAARARAARYTPDVTARAMRGLYDRLLGQSRRAAA